MEVVSLSLRAILEKLPQELRALVNQMPDAAAKIVLPVNTIVKQLPTGAVRMSFASLLRQSPQGTFRKAQVEERQMVDVPLAEIFKSMDPSRLGRRSDQRRYDVPDAAAGLFGRSGKSRSVTAAEEPAEETVHLDDPADAPAPVAAKPAHAPVSVARVEQPRVVKMPGISPAPEPAAAIHPPVEAPAAPAPNAPPARPAAASAKQQQAAVSQASAELVLPFVELAKSWPEGIRSELAEVPGDTRLRIPASAVGGGLQKGKVAFPWSQIRMWMQPPLGGNPAIAENQDLVFPLKIVAPAFVAATGAKKRTEGSEIDQSIPDFFGHAQAPAFKLAQPAPAEKPPVAEAPQPIKIVHEEPVPAVPDDAPPAPAAPAQPVATGPAEIVQRACELPGVAGAVVALGEGLVVAQKLPPGLSADTFAAFMPQIFSRLEKYTEEMHLGATTAITVETAHGPCRMTRAGKLYLGVLGRAGTTLPEVVGTLARQLAAHHS